MHGAAATTAIYVSIAGLIIVAVSFPFIFWRPLPDKWLRALPLPISIILSATGTVLNLIGLFAFCIVAGPCSPKTLLSIGLGPLVLAEGWILAHPLLADNEYGFGAWDLDKAKIGQGYRPGRLKYNTMAIGLVLVFSGFLCQTYITLRAESIAFEKSHHVDRNNSLLSGDPTSIKYWNGIRVKVELVGNSWVMTTAEPTVLVGGLTGHKSNAYFDPGLELGTKDQNNGSWSFPVFGDKPIYPASKLPTGR